MHRSDGRPQRAQFPLSANAEANGTSSFSLTRAFFTHQEREFDLRSLVTGASGFIGSRLAQTLSKRFGQSNVQLLFPPFPKHAKEKKRADELALFGFDIVYADLLKLPADFSDQIKPFDVLYHLAAFGETESKDIHLNDVNDIGTQMLLSALSRRLKRARVVFTSTLAAVDRLFPDNTPLSEDYPCHPRTAYGISKLNAEANVKSGADLMGYEWIIMRLPTIIGSGYRSGGLTEAIVESLTPEYLIRPAQLARSNRSSACQ